MHCYDECYMSSWTADECYKNSCTAMMSAYNSGNYVVSVALEQLANLDLVWSGVLLRNQWQTTEESFYPSLDWIPGLFKVVKKNLCLDWILSLFNVVKIIPF